MPLRESYPERRLDAILENNWLAILTYVTARNASSIIPSRLFPVFDIELIHQTITTETKSELANPAMSVYKQIYDYTCISMNYFLDILSRSPGTTSSITSPNDFFNLLETNFNELLQNSNFIVKELAGTRRRPTFIEFLETIINHLLPNTIKNQAKVLDDAIIKFFQKYNFALYTENEFGTEYITFNNRTSQALNRLCSLAAYTILRINQTNEEQNFPVSRDTVHELVTLTRTLTPQELFLENPFCASLFNSNGLTLQAIHAVKNPQIKWR